MMSITKVGFVLMTLLATVQCQDGAPAPNAAAPAGAPAPDNAAAPAPPAPDMAGMFAAAYNQDIIINSDLFSDKPEILSGGLGFTNIIGVSNNTDEAVVRAANGTWSANVTCSSGAPPPGRVLTSATPTTMYTTGFNCTADNYDGLPVCFSWPVLPSSISNTSFLITLSDGSTVVPPCIGMSPNFEFNERQCVVLFAKFGNRIPSTEPGSLFVSRVEVVQGASLKLVGKSGPVSAAGLSFDNPTGKRAAACILAHTQTRPVHAACKSPYDDNNGPVIMVAKLSKLNDVGEGISQPPIAPQTAFPNSGVSLYGAYDGSLGPDGDRYRLRLFYSGGMTPDGVMAFQPTKFATHFYLMASDADGQEVRINATGVEYDLGQQLGSIQVLGMADTGVVQDSYDECYQASRNLASSSSRANCKQAAEDYDNYLDVILDASSPEAAASLTTLMAFQTDEGYTPLYNPGGPGNDPTPGVRYSSPSPPQSVNITLALDDPMVVTYCNLNGTLITNPEACAAAVAPAPTPAPAPAPAA
ncbi:hypothetical protein ACK3TF_004982 [Chlorella vulgaris]